MKHRYIPYLLQGLTLAAWGCALVGYFGPWIGHPSAALAWNAYDLFDLSQRLPQIEHGVLTVNLQALHLPLLGLGMLVPLMSQSSSKHAAAISQGFIRVPSRRFWRQSYLVCLGVTLSVITLPPYPAIMNAWRAPGWQRLAFWWGIAGILCTALAGYLAPHLGRYHPWISLACIALTGIPASLTFRRLLRAITELHAALVNPGWGFWLYVIGALGLALCFCIQGLKKLKGEKG